MSSIAPPVAPSPRTTRSRSSTSGANGFLINRWRAIPDGFCHRRKSLLVADDDGRNESAHNSVVRHPDKVFVERIERPLVFVFKKSHEKAVRHNDGSSPQFSAHDVIKGNFTRRISGSEVTTSSRERSWRRSNRSQLADGSPFSSYRTSSKTTEGLAGWPSGIAKKGYEYFSLKSAMSAIFGTPALSTVDESPSENAESIRITEIPDSCVPGSRSAKTESAPSNASLKQSGDVDDSATTTSTPPAVVSPSQRRRRKHGYCLDVEEVKVLTSRLNLVTRRPSVQAWRQEHMSGNGSHFAAGFANVNQRCDVDSDDDDVATKWSPEFRDRISASLDWLKSELVIVAISILSTCVLSITSLKL